MSKKTKSDSAIWLLILGIALLLIVVLYYFYKSEKIKQFKDDLEDRIHEKEKTISYLQLELEKLRSMKSKLMADAIKFYKTLKCLSVLFLLMISISVFLLTKANVYEAAGIIFTCITTIYCTVSIVVKNTVGNFDDTLAVLQNYFIERNFRKNGFEPLLIEVFESKLDKEQRELHQLIEQKQQYKLN